MNIQGKIIRNIVVKFIDNLAIKCCFQNELEVNMTNKNALEVGDVIRFHDWGVGGNLFGIIIEYEDELYHSKLNIWRPRDIYFLHAYGIDNIEIIQSLEGLSEFKQNDLKDVIKKAQDENIDVNISWC